MKPALLYAARSTEDKRGSIDGQLEECRQMAAREGWSVQGEYQEEGFSAYHGNRGPRLEACKARAVELAELHGSWVLLSAHSDRVSRGAGDAPGSADHLVEVLFWANRHSVEVRFVQQDLIGDKQLDIVLSAIQGMRNTSDSLRKAQSVRHGMERSVKGRAQGGPPPYAFRYSSDANHKGKLVVVKPEAEIVKRIFREYLEGKSVSAISRGLHKDGVPTLKGKLWRVSTVGGILRSRVYRGEVSFAGEWYPGQHEPIVDRRTWARVQEVLAQQPRRRVGRPAKGRHLFANSGAMLRCGGCGECLTARTNGGYEMYYCNGRSKMGKEYCSMPHLRRSDIDSAVYRYFQATALDLEATAMRLGRVRSHHFKLIQDALRDAARADEEASEAYERIRRDYTRGALSAEDFAELKPELLEERDAARAELKRMRVQEMELGSRKAVNDLEAQTLMRL